MSSCFIIAEKLLKYPNMIVDLCISLNSVILFFLHTFWNSVMHDCYMHNMVLFLFVIMRFPFLSLIIVFVMKFTLFDLNLATSTFLCLLFTGYIFSHAFPINFSCVSCRQSIVEACIFISFLPPPEEDDSVYFLFAFILNIIYCDSDIKEEHKVKTKSSFFNA